MAYTNIDDPSAYFQIALYTGTGSTQSITNDGNSDMQPDWVWVKSRSNGGTHNVVFDSSRGVNNRLITNLTIAEDTGDGYGVVSAFNTDGFTVNPQTNLINVGGNGYTYAAWQWKANGGTTSSNTDGSITSTVQANTDAGFSIVTYTVGVAAGNHSVGHGLGVAPDFIAIKCRGAAQDWLVYHSSLGSGNYIKLNTTAASVAYADSFGDGVTSSVFGYNYAGTSIANQPYVAYCFAEKQGYSKFGKYVGNGNVNGPMVYLGFKPAVIILKRSDSTTGGNWHIIDNKRSASGGANVNVYSLFPNLDAAESTGEAESTYGIDFLSNGFKIRASHSTRNTSGGSYIYMAFAENPFVTSTGIPTTAR